MEDGDLNSSQWRQPPRVKTIAEMRMMFQCPPSSKSKQRPKPRLGQVMSTSKKLTMMKHSGMAHLQTKRAINFSDNYAAPSSCVKKFPPRHTYAPSINETNASTYTFVRPPVRNISDVDDTSPVPQTKNFTSASPSKKKVLFKSSPKTDSAKKKRKPLCAIPIPPKDTEKSDSSSDSSDKENDRDKKMDQSELLERTKTLLLERDKSVKKLKLLKSTNDPAGFLREVVACTQQNFETVSHILQLSMKTLENSLELFNAFVADAKFLDSVGGSGDVPNVVVTSSEEVDEESGNLRKLALKNLQSKKLTDELPTASKIAYESMKSGIGFLKTPKRDNTDSATPNTKSRNITRSNLQRQLQSLYGEAE